jgi:hypothetical protein
MKKSILGLVVFILLCCTKLCLGDDYGVCCVREDCKYTTYEGCVAYGEGTDPFVSWGGVGTYCDPQIVHCLPKGACCVDGTCSIWTEAFCLYQAGGTYLGDWTTCEPNECPVSCCKWNAKNQNYDPCQILPRWQCEDYLDLPKLDGPFPACRISCDLVNPMVPCCRSSSIIGALFPTYCTIESIYTCTGPNARKMWGSETCTPNPCPQGFTYTGACCLTTGECVIVTRSPEAFGNQCSVGGPPPAGIVYGTYLGNGSTCVGWDCATMAPIPPTAACCVSLNQFFATYTKQQCDAIGGEFFPNEPCSITGNTCELPKTVCCFTTGICTLTTTRDCIARFGTSNPSSSTCVPNPCVQSVVGACCFTTNLEPPTFQCITIPQADCLNLPTVDPTVVFPPVWNPLEGCEPIVPPSLPYRKGGACGDPGAKNTIGACCNNGMCSVVEKTYCKEENFIPDIGCQPIPCEIPMGGACCQGTSCSTETSLAACTALGGFFTPYVTCTASPLFCDQLPVACCTTYGCQLLSAVDCEYEGFTPGAAGSSCTPDPCE